MTSFRIKNGDDINYAKLTKIVFFCVYIGIILTLALTYFG